MAIETYALYLMAFGGWAFAINRDGGIGIGFRFLYAMHLAMFFLVGPLLGAASGVEGTRFQGVDLEKGVQVSLAGMLAYLATAYWIFPRLTNHTPLVPPSLRRQLADPIRLDSQFKLGWTLIGLGVATLPLVSRTQNLPTIGAVLGQTTYLFDTGMAMLCLYAAAGGQRRWYLAAAPLFLVRGAVYAAASGHSGALFVHSLVFACILLFAFHASLRRVGVVLALAVVIMIPAGMWLSGRDRLRESVERNADFATRLANFVEIFTRAEPPNVTNLLEAYRDRGDFSHLMASAVSFTPAVQPFAMGDTFLQAGYAVVPRILWPNKPIVAGGNEFVSTFTGVNFNIKTSVGMAHMFEFYANFGVIGVIVGMALIGALMAWMESFYYRRGVTSLFVEFTLLFVNWTLTFYADRSTLLVMSVIPGLVLCWMLRGMLRGFVQWPYFNLPAPARTSKTAPRSVGQ